MTIELLVLHALRLRSIRSTEQVAARFGLDIGKVDEEVLDQQALGQVSWVEFGATAGWSLTERGKVRGEQLLAAELDAAGARAHVEGVYEEFLPLNARLRSAVTDWQIRPTDDDPFAVNRHRDAVWDARVVAELTALARELRPLIRSLEESLPRFSGYDRRFSSATARVQEGERAWVDAIELESCHTVWFELHEDLLATLGLQR